MINFNKIHPCPPGLSEEADPAQLFGESPARKWVSANWGTCAWGFYAELRDGSDQTTWPFPEPSLFVDCKWSPCDGIVRELSRQYPAAPWLVEWSEEQGPGPGGGFVGYALYRAAGNWRTFGRPVDGRQPLQVDAHYSAPRCALPRLAKLRRVRRRRRAPPVRPVQERLLLLAGVPGRRLDEGPQARVPAAGGEGGRGLPPVGPDPADLRRGPGPVVPPPVVRRGAQARRRADAGPRAPAPRRRTGAHGAGRDDEGRRVRSSCRWPSAWRRRGKWATGTSTATCAPTPAPSRSTGTPSDDFSRDD